MKILIILFILLFPQLVYATKVLLIIPDKEGDVFWSLVQQASVASAKSLGVQLEVLYGGENRFATLEMIEKIVARPIKPDYLIFRPFHGNSIKVFDQIEASGISFVTLEQPINGEEALKLKKPKQKYTHWIGEVAFDNAKGGELLLSALVNELYVRHPNISPSIIGLGGNFDNLSMSRQQSLINLEHVRDPRLNQIFPTYWEPQNIASNFELMFRRYPQTNIFWCAGDQLAIETFEQHQLMFDRPIVVGGFDWLPEALSKIQQGKLTASVGGHFLMGAIAITKIFDYQHGIDGFLSHPEAYDFELITKDNVETHLDFMRQKKWQNVNFNQFSAFKMGDKIRPLTMQNIINPNHN